MNSYEERSSMDLATMPYVEYLQTDHWQTMRRLKLEEAHHDCQLCGHGAIGTLQVHHRTYERRGAERLADLIVLCAECHGRHHREIPPVPLEDEDERVKTLLLAAQDPALSALEATLLRQKARTIGGFAEGEAIPGITQPRVRTSGELLEHLRQRQQAPGRFGRNT